MSSSSESSESEEEWDRIVVPTPGENVYVRGRNWGIWHLLRPDGRLTCGTRVTLHLMTKGQIHGWQRLCYNCRHRPTSAPVLPVWTCHWQVPDGKKSVRPCKHNATNPRRIWCTRHFRLIYGLLDNTLACSDVIELVLAHFCRENYDVLPPKTKQCYPSQKKEYPS